MEIPYYDEVLAGMQEFLEQQAFQPTPDGGFANEKKQFRITFDEKKHLYQLQVADPVEAGEPVYQVIASWLFDESQTARDAQAVAIDFVDELRRQLGVAPPRVRRTTDLSLPDSRSKSDTPDALALCQKTLAIFPQFKDVYRDHMERYGEFLCIDFFSRTLAPKLRELLDEGNKKQLKKVFDMLSEFFVTGDRNVGNLIVVNICCGAVGGDRTRFERASELLQDYPYLQAAVRFVFERQPRDRRLREMLGAAENPA